MKRKIAVIIGSDSDALQCELGIRYLAQAVEEGKVEVSNVHTSSIHWNHDHTVSTLELLAMGCDVVITGAGMANHLTGTADHYLRNQLGNDTLVVVGVAFAGKTMDQDEAAKLSISQVPKTQVVFRNPVDGVQFVGAKGFLLACQYAVEGELPVLAVPSQREPKCRTLEEFIQFIETKKSQL